MSLLIKFIIVLCFVCIPYANQDNYISFKYASRYYDFSPRIIKSLEDKTESFESPFFKPYNKIPEIQDVKDMGIDGETFIHSIRYEYKDNTDSTKFFDLAIPQVAKIIDFKSYYLNQNYYYAFRSKAIKTITKKRNRFACFFTKQFM